ncbi:MAG: hypothetical protein IJU57_06550 [Clostridia bacterium]|nr:hypothetical protein [Clostridia bacterium]
MTKLFVQILQMSISASYVIIAILLARLILKKAPKKYSYALWSVAAFRLLCPYSFGSVFSLFNLHLGKKEKPAIDLTGVTAAPGTETIVVDTGIPVVSQTIQQVTNAAPAAPVSETIGETIVSATQEITPVQQAISPLQIVAWIWLIGVIALLTYGIISYVSLKRKMRMSMPLRDNIRQAYIRTPFILGFLKPTIYIPFDLEPVVENISISHERCHIRRGDPIVKFFSYLILILHWFNPLCWLAYMEMEKDMEMSVDEYVLSHYKDVSTSYSTALLSFSTGKRFALASPLAFGENSVRARIINVISNRRSSRWLSALACLLCVAVLVACGTNGIRAESDNQTFEPVSTDVLSQEQSEDIKLNTLRAVASVFVDNYCDENGIHLTGIIADRFQPEELWDENHTHLIDWYQLHMYADFDDPVLRPDCTIAGCNHQNPSCEAWTLRSQGYPINLSLGDRYLSLTQIRQFMYPAEERDSRFPNGNGVLIEEKTSQNGKTVYQVALPDVVLIDNKIFFDGQYLVFLVARGVYVLDTKSGSIVKEIVYESDASTSTNSLYVTKDNQLVLVNRQSQRGVMFDTSTWQRTTIEGILNDPDWYTFKNDGNAYIAEPLFDGSDLQNPYGLEHSQVFKINGEKALVRFSDESRDETAIVDINSGEILSGTVPMKNMWDEDIPTIYMESDKYYVFRLGVAWNENSFPAPPDYYDGLNNENTETYRYIYAFIDKDVFWNGETSYTAFLMP